MILIETNFQPCIRSVPIQIPNIRTNLISRKVQVYEQDYKHELWFSVKDLSGELVIGRLLNTPTNTKPYKKGDSVLFTIDRVHTFKYKYEK